MKAVFRALICCLSCVFCALASSPEEILAKDAVLDDFLNQYGDEPGQNALGAAKGVIENGEGRAYMGEGYWFAYCDTRGSTIENGEGVTIGESNFDKAIDNTNFYLHLKLAEKDTSDKSYVGFGCNLVKEGTYVDLSKMSAFTIEAKGTGTVRVNFITKDYLDAGEEWGYYGADLALTSGDFTATSISKATIEPAEWSYGAKGDKTWAADGSIAVTKIQFDLPPGKSAEIYIKKITFTGMKYSDFGFIALSIASHRGTENLRNILTVSHSQVSYSLARPQNLSIGLFNAAGSRVATLFSGSAEAGSHELPMNLRGNVAKGNYFIALTGTNASVVRPVTIVK
ncbi:MAG: hypothetical protein JXB48_12605 [Candidatus Latescibacteria bacterium]|nr:hypothetical protein [Candidatus Latescibacterota bacterium]